MGINIILSIVAHTYTLTPYSMYLCQDELSCPSPAREYLHPPYLAMTPPLRCLGLFQVISKLSLLGTRPSAPGRVGAELRTVVPRCAADVGRIRAGLEGVEDDVRGLLGGMV